MKRLWLILGREYRQRLHRPSFWVLTLLIPVVLAALYALPVLAAQRGAGRSTVLVVDQTGLFDGGLQSTDDVAFKPMPSLEYARRQAAKDDLILFVPMRETTIPRDAFLYYHGNSPSLSVQSAVDGQLQALLRNAIMEDVYQVEPSVYHSVASANIRLHTQDSASGHESHLRVKSVVAMVLAVLMTLALLLFGVEVMRSVQEEKQNRVSEVIATSVRPVHLLMGKAGAVALVAVTQLVLWALLTALCIKGIQASAPDLFAQARAQQEQRALASKGVEATAQYNSTVQLVDETVQGLTAIRLPLVAGVFLLCFLLGYMLYGALLAALASRLEGDVDAVQWTLLTGTPLLLALVLGTFVLRSPAGPLAVWLTVVPFTAPVATMLRLPFGLPLWQMGVGIALSVLCIVAAALLAARTYRRHLVR
ncbi:MAG: ABC transporter permease [Bacteroidales bacterium]|nr:ABC transporter permease [Bacteroidales bacterium]